MTALVVAAVACAAWVYLLTMRGGFWRASERDDTNDTAEAVPSSWPRVVAVVPARDEAEVIAASVGSLLRQDYPGALTILVVDDHSTDGTAVIVNDVARGLATTPLARELKVLSAPDLPDGWTGKLWALHSGASHAMAMAEPPDYLWFSDADISYTTESLTTLVRRAQQEGLALTSLMAKLHCASFAERALIPAFIFFFQMLYPFKWVNRPQSSTAAAAGGCMLVRREALEAAGGVSAVRAELIDDCALGRLMKRQGPIRLALTVRARSFRAFATLGDVRPMISRSAYAQLQYSPFLLIGTVLALVVTCVAPPVLAIAATGLPQWLGAATWALMALAFQPTLGFYGVSRWWSIALPAIAALYLAFTLDSAWQHARGRGGMWKGRAHRPAQDSG